MRHVALGLAALVAACAGAPPPVPHTPEKVAVAEPKPEPEKPAPPAPLAAEDVTLTQKSEFISLGLGSIHPKLLTDDELVKRLPAAAKLDFQSVERAQKAAREADRAQSRAASEFYGCDECKQRPVLELRNKAAIKASVAADQALDKAVERASKSLGKQLGAAKAAPEIGIALARIELRGTNHMVDDSPSQALEYAEEQADGPGVDALELAAKLAGPDQEPGQRVRQELLYRLWSKADADRARQLVNELAPVAPKEWRAELELRAALFDALEGNDARAAEGFEKGLAERVPGSSVSRATLATGALLARYRGLDFERTISAAMRLFEENDRPEPPPPAPPPPPVKPKPAKKPGRLSVAARKAALRDAAEFGMLGLISSASLDPGVGENGALRLAADAVERLDRDPTSLDGPARARAGVLSLLAVRALYRNDLEKARQYAEASRSLGALAETRDAVDVLRALALKAGDKPRADELSREASKLPWGGQGGFFGQQSEPDERELAAFLRSSESEQKKSPDEAAKEPPVAQNLRSALRACLEPVRTRLPKATGTGKDRRIATITLDAKVFDDGHAELVVDADSKDGSMAQVLECLKGAGPRMLAHAPSSVSAKIVLHDSARAGSGFGAGGFGFGGIGSLFGSEQSMGGLVGSEIGESYGYGGLGLRGVGTGGGGTGEGIGLGSIGTLGHGAGTGVGYGAGTGKGRLGGKKKPAPAKKPPPKPAVK